MINTYQSLVGVWMKEVLGNQTVRQRGFRFVEEAAELAQALGLECDKVKAVIDYVYSREPDKVSEEIGGVLVTLFGLCDTIGVSLQELFVAEYQKICRPEMKERARSRQPERNAVAE